MTDELAERRAQRAGIDPQHLADVHAMLPGLLDAGYVAHPGDGTDTHQVTLHGLKALRHLLALASLNIGPMYGPAVPEPFANTFDVSIAVVNDMIEANQPEPPRAGNG